LKLIVDTQAQSLTIEGDQALRLPLYSDEAFEQLSQIWLKVAWNQKYTYTFTWLGRPIIQLPEDMFRLQEVIYAVKPDVIIETGVAHGGSLVFYATLCEAMGKGHVIGVDVDIRLHNRKAIEEHVLFPRITLIEGSSTDPAVVRQVHGSVKPGETSLVILDSAHTKAHVLAELEAYHALIPLGSYIVATDGVMQDLHDVPRGSKEWMVDNPVAAVLTFLRGHPEFALVSPTWAFNESSLSRSVTHWPTAWLKRVR
jgi:cephalosporin hydroxylase